VVERDGVPVTVFEVPGTPIDIANANLGAQNLDVYRTLRPVCDVPRMSTYAFGAIINRGARRMAPGDAYVNVGVWQGYTLFSGMAGNPDKPCIGIDNFSEFTGPREVFLEQFEHQRGPAHQFHSMDYEDYFAERHEGPIGLYLYDGDHAYEHQLRGLQVAEPFFSEDCVVIVDDTNWEEPRQATLDFIAQSDRQYTLLLDTRTATNWHPTLWNGVMVFQATGGTREGHERRPAGAAPAPRPRSEPARVASDSLVSLIVCDPAPESDALQQTIEEALAQTWPNLEVIVVSPESANEAVGSTVSRYEDRVVSVPAADGPGEGAKAGVAASRGEFVALIDCYSELSNEAVRMGLALPRLVRFDRGALRTGKQSRTYRALKASDDISATIPAGEPFVLVNGRRQHTLAETIDAGPPLSLVEPAEERDEIDDATAVTRLEQLQAEGAQFAVILWLAERPEFERRLRAEGRSRVDNERVLITELSVPA
jgi:Methyltransferase domain/Glycosyl transferase family 2